MHLSEHYASMPQVDSVDLGAPADEIEITSAMMEAGLNEFLSYDDRVGAPQDAVEAIFIAMMRASPSFKVAAISKRSRQVRGVHDKDRKKHPEDARRI
jgi:hypothetical protein